MPQHYNSQKKTCKRGHPLTGDNLYVNPYNKSRQCCACERIRAHRPENRMKQRWQVMRERCLGRNRPEWHRYGGRGITICDRWINSYQNFRDDMGLPPSPHHSLDRIDNDKGYSPDNCRWATRKEQSRNRCDNVTISFDGKSLTIAEWSEVTGICHATIRSRYARKWPIEQILNVKPSLDNRWRRPHSATHSPK